MAMININNYNDIDNLKSKYNINMSMYDDYISIDFNDNDNDTFIFKTEMNNNNIAYISIVSKTNYDWLSMLNIYSMIETL